MLKRFLILALFFGAFRYWRHFFKYWKRLERPKRNWNRMILSSQLLLWNPSQDPQTPNYALTVSNDWLKEQRPLVICMVKSYEEQEQLRELLETPCLFCSTKEGQKAIASQLKRQLVTLPGQGGHIEVKSLNELL